MTAEVAILNSEAVVLAADSAVTIPGAKVYNSANKLFELSLSDPVAVMFYGSGALGPLPWDTIVKEYRKLTTNSAYSTVEEYSGRFVDHLSTMVENVKDFSDRFRIDYVINVANVVLENIFSSAQFIFTSIPPKLVEKAREDIILDLMGNARDRFSNSSDPRLTGEEVAGELHRAIPNWEDFSNRKLKGLPVTGRIRQVAFETVVDYLLYNADADLTSGVVVAGFGCDDLFPGLSHCQVSYGLTGDINNEQLERIRVGENGRKASIRGFAQRDMVDTFMNGIHPDYAAFLDEFVRVSFHTFSDTVGLRASEFLNEDHHQKLVSVLQATRKEVFRHFPDRLTQEQESISWGPIMSIVSALTKEELAEMAESLVHLTSLRRRVSPDLENVGGPVDVAVISKGDGLVWIRRKHYFLPELNPRFFGRMGSINGWGQKS